MKLKDLLVEIESQDADYMKKEEADNEAMRADIEKYNGQEVTIIVGDATVTAIIGFDKSDYVTLSKLSVEDGEVTDLNSIKAKAESKLDKDLSFEIEI